MPIHLNGLDVVSEVAGMSSALIVPCNMCPAVTVAVDEKRPFMQLFRSLLKSPPWEQHLKALQSRLREKGVKADVFKSNLYHQWFVCMWTSGRRKKLQKAAEKYDAVISLGCDTANETVRDAVKPNGCKVIEGMEVTGLMNAKMSLSVKGDISFKDCKIIPISQSKKSEHMSA
jgi:hypothetical protein